VNRITLKGMREFSEIWGLVDCGPERSWLNSGRLGLGLGLVVDGYEKLGKSIVQFRKVEARVLAARQ